MPSRHLQKGVRAFVEVSSRPCWRYRFSAFWLRSKCSICSYQLNIWYVPHWGTSILNWFLELGEKAGACSALATGWPGIAVPPGTAHFPPVGNYKQRKTRLIAPLVNVHVLRTLSKLWTSAVPYALFSSRERSRYITVTSRWLLRDDVRWHRSMPRGRCLLECSVHSGPLARPPRAWLNGYISTLPQMHLLGLGLGFTLNA